MDLRRRFFIAAAFTSLLFTLTHAAYAAPGDLDPTFGTSGIALVDWGGIYNNGEFLAVQPDGKILVVGEAAFSGSDAVGVARLNPDGSLDTSFGHGGRISVHLFPHDFDVEDLALQPDGKIVVGGSVDVDPGPGFNDEFWLLRLNPDGSHDLGFGTGGVVMHGLFSSSVDWLNALAVQDDGRILAAGGVERTPGEDFEFVVVRYLPDGRLDPDFGTGGKVVTDLMPADSFFLAIALQPDGKIVATGVSLSRECVLVRYDSQGRLDPSFGGDGIALSTVSPSLAAAPQSVVVQPDGKIVAGGIAFPGVQGGDFALWRFLPDGSMDTEFGVGGRALTDFPGGHDTILALALQADGGIVGVGHTHYNQTPLSDFALARYTSDGQLDPDFGNGGTVVTDLDLYDFATDVVSLPDGRLVVTGGVHGPPGDARVLRYLGPELAVNEPPVIAGGAVSPGVLWPANHKMIGVRVSYTVTDDRDPAAAVQCSLSVASNEPVRGTGDGNTAPDWQVVDSHRVFLRAERSGRGNGRTYTITIACTDTAGASSTHQVKVQVPKNRGK